MTVVAIVNQKGGVGKTTLVRKGNHAARERRSLGQCPWLEPLQHHRPRWPVCAKPSNLLELCRRDSMLIQPANPALTKIIIHRRPRGHRRKIARIRTKISSSGNEHHCILCSYRRTII